MDLITESVGGDIYICQELIRIYSNAINILNSTMRDMYNIKYLIHLQRMHKCSFISIYCHWERYLLWVIDSRLIHTLIGSYAIYYHWDNNTNQCRRESDTTVKWQPTLPPTWTNKGSIHHYSPGPVYWGMKSTGKRYILYQHNVGIDILFTHKHPPTPHYTVSNTQHQGTRQYTTSAAEPVLVCTAQPAWLSVQHTTPFYTHQSVSVKTCSQ